MFDRFVGLSKTQCMSVVEELIGDPHTLRLAARYEEEINSALESSV